MDMGVEVVFTTARHCCPNYPGATREPPVVSRGFRQVRTRGKVGPPGLLSKLSDLGQQVLTSKLWHTSGLEVVTPGR